MPCDTPPPPPALDEIDDIIEEDPDDLMYEFVDESELGDMIPDDSVVTFHGHKDSVFCCNFDKTGEYAISGGQDDTAFVWDTATGSTKFQCNGHSESVISASFSPDSQYAATADMNGLVQCWEISSGSQIWQYEASEIAWMKWLHKTNVLIGGTIDGTCWRWSIPKIETQTFQSSGVGSTAGCISPNDEKVAIGYVDGTVKFWNISDTSIAGTVTRSTGHKLAVTTMKYHPDNSLVITGSEDGCVKLIKTSNFKVIWTINGCDANHEHEDVSVESVGFNLSHSLAAVATNCGLLSVWDISTQTKRSSIELSTAVVKLICDDSSPTIYVGTAEGVVQAYDVRSGVVTKTWNGHLTAILDLALSTDHRFILSSSDDYSCKLFELSSAPGHQ